MSQTIRSNDKPSIESPGQSNELADCQTERAIIKLDDLIARAHLKIQTESEEFLFESLNCGELFTPTCSQQTTSGTQDDQTTGDQADPDDCLDQLTFSQSTYDPSTHSQPKFSQSYSQSYSPLAYSPLAYRQPTHSQLTYFQSSYSQSDQIVCSQESQHLNNQLPSSPATDRLQTGNAVTIFGWLMGII